jgi:hypothetical protein
MIRTAFVAVVASLALAAIGATSASAASNTGGLPAITDAGPLMKTDVTGLSKNGNKTFTGTYGIYKFVVKNGKVWSVGTVTGKFQNGKLKGKHVKRGNVMMPVDTSKLGDTNTASAAQTTSCTVLHLVLGPVNLNLLGLQVTLGGGLQANQPIVLDITAQRGGGLLGDLLCGLTDSLGGQLGQISQQLQQLASALNALAGLLGGLQATQP